MKEIVLDTETTGISVKEGHRIVEIGCIELDNLIPTENKFHCYLNPERKVSEKAFKVHGYSDEFLSKQKKFNEISEQFLNFIQNKKLIIHNAEFDLSHLNNDFEMNKRTNSNISYFKKIIKPTTDEINKHEKYLRQNLKKNFY